MSTVLSPELLMEEKQEKQSGQGPSSLLGVHRHLGHVDCERAREEGSHQEQESPGGWAAQKQPWSQMPRPAGDCLVRGQTCMFSESQTEGHGTAP